MRRLPLLSLVLFSLLFMPGFVCATRVERVEGEVDALRIQFEEIQQRINNDQTQITEMVLRADTKLAELEELQLKAADLLKRNSVDLALQLDTQKQDLAELRGQLEDHSRQITQLNEDLKSILSSFSATSGGQGVILPDNADDLYQFGLNAEAAGNWPEAAAAFEEFASTYTSDERHEDALFRLVGAAYNSADYANAFAAARSSIKSYPKSKNNAETIKLMGESALNLGNCDIAVASFETLKDMGVKGAKARLKEIKKQCH